MLLVGGSLSLRRDEVRREHDALDTVNGELPENGQRSFGGTRSVVDAREEVRVDVDHDGRPQLIRSRGSTSP